MKPENLIGMGAYFQTIFKMKAGFRIKYVPHDSPQTIRIPILEIAGKKTITKLINKPIEDYPVKYEHITLGCYSTGDIADGETEYIYAGYSEKLNTLIIRKE